MTRIAIDATAPIACTASGQDLLVRIEQVEYLRDRMRSIERTEEGLLLTFAPGAEMEAHLDRFVVEEKGCCAFWGFEVTCTTDSLTLRWDGPESVRIFLDELDRFFRSDEPLTAFAGLL